MDPAAEVPEALRGAIPQTQYLDDVASRLAPLGFTGESTLAAVSICRDELTQHLIAAVTDRWGPTFALGGLGGVPSLGRTGWGACLAHVPDTVDRPKLLVIGATHIGLGPDGTPGHNLRRNQAEPTATCGALSALLDTWGDRTPARPDGSGLSDGEARMLRRLVEAALDAHPEGAVSEGAMSEGNLSEGAHPEGAHPEGKLPDETPLKGALPGGIVELTLAATKAVQTEMMTQLDALDPWDNMDIAVFTGVQVHLDGTEDHVLPVSATLRGAGGSHTPLL